jgi:hypothetical protein
MANGIEDTTADNRGKKLLNEENQQESTDGGQIKVMDQEELLQLERFPVAHKLPTTKDDGVVDDNEDARLLKRRHRRLPRHKSEILGRVTDNCLEGLAEDGP